MMIFLSEFFLGNFRFTRNVSYPALAIEGTASFLESKDVILYSESGSYQLGDRQYNFSQKRIFEHTSTGFSIYKKEGTLLHEFSFPVGYKLPISVKHIHNCKEDSYSVVFQFNSFNNFLTQYVVSGPSKSYSITTAYTRI